MEIIAIKADTITGAPISLRISVTDRCQLSCIYCMPHGRHERCSRADFLTIKEIMNFVTMLKHRFTLKKIHLTGGEPLLRHGIVDLVAQLSAAGDHSLVLTTNGQLLSGIAESLKRAGLHRVNISLDTLDTEKYRELTGGGELSLTLKGIDAALASGLTPVKLNTVVLRNHNDDEVIDIAGYGMKRSCHVRFLELMPVGTSAVHFNERFVSSSEVFTLISQAYTLGAIPGKSEESSRNYTAVHRDGATGVIGFISPYSSPFCEGCRRLRLTAHGKLIGCLVRSESHDIRSLLRDASSSGGQLLIHAVTSAMNTKHTYPRFDSRRAMVDVGG